LPFFGGFGCFWQHLAVFVGFGRICPFLPDLSVFAVFGRILPDLSVFVRIWPVREKYSLIVFLYRFGQKRPNSAEFGHF